MVNVFRSLLAGTLLDLLLAEPALELLSASSSPLPEEISIYKTLQISTIKVSWWAGSETSPT